MGPRERYHEILSDADISAPTSSSWETVRGAGLHTRYQVIYSVLEALLGIRIQRRTQGMSFALKVFHAMEKTNPSIALLFSVGWPWTAP